jgi:ElaB/YqjD/DUF883 family membrane-anchored ribosome-binding protein
MPDEIGQIIDNNDEVIAAEVELLEEKKKNEGKKGELMASINRLVLIGIGSLCAGATFGFAIKESEAPKSHGTHASKDALEMVRDDVKSLSTAVSSLTTITVEANKEAENCSDRISELKQDYREDMKELKRLIAGQTQGMVAEIEARRMFPSAPLMQPTGTLPLLGESPEVPVYSKEVELKEIKK